MEYSMAEILQKALLRKHEVLRLIGLSNSTFYNRIKTGVISRGVPMGPRLKGWPSSEIQAYIQACIDERDAGRGGA